MPTIRALLKAFEYPLAAPHVYTGVESTLPLLVRMAAASAPETPSKRPRRAATALQTVPTDISDTKTLALVVVILFYVLARMKDQEITPEQFEEWREKALMTLISSPPGNDCSEDEINTEIESLMPLAQQEGWLGMEWFSNIAPAEQEDIMDDLEITNGRTNSRKRSFKESFKSENIGLGTMMQETTDYLGERQREDYRMWKAKIMARVEEIEGSREVVISH
jgi:origin recognition complex subunit 6